MRCRAVLLHELARIAGRGCSGSRRCVQALDVRDEAALVDSLRDLIAAGRCAAKVNARMDTELRAAAGERSAPPVKGAVCNRAVQP